jgi:predicted RNA-binding protein YlxR (DUF448 family)
VGCRQQRPANELQRCALGADGHAVCDRVAPGRGAWLCAGSMDCFDLAARRRGFERAWRHTVDRAALDDLRDAFQEAAGRMEQSWAVGRTGAPAAATKD